MFAKGFDINSQPYELIWAYDQEEIRVNIAADSA